MKTVIVLWLAVFGMLSAAPDVDWRAWQWEAPFEVGQAGLVRLEVPPVVLDVSRPDLSDLRVLSPSGVETPYLLERSIHRRSDELQAAGFKASLSGVTTVMEASTGTSTPIRVISLLSPAVEFLKSVAIDGRKGGGGWHEITSKRVVFRQAGGVEQMRIPIEAGVWDELRITVDDSRSKPVAFTGVRLSLVPEKSETVELPATLGAREDKQGETRLALDVGARNLDLAGIRFEISDPVFTRRCVWGYPSPVDHGGSLLETLGAGTLIRSADEAKDAVDTIPLIGNGRTPTRELTAMFHNGDSPPLHITGAKVFCYPTVLAFHGTEPGVWRLISGKPDAETPDYQSEELSEALGKATGDKLVPGPIRANEKYRKPPVVPGVETRGVAIDLADWSRRRVVTTASSGAIRIQPDPLALAACRDDFGDFRLVQNGRQIPYLIMPGAVLQKLDPKVDSMPPDPKHPTVSRWKVTLPVEGLPVAEIHLVNTASLSFVRKIVVQIERKTEAPTVETETVTEADWRHIDGKYGNGEEGLKINLGGRRMPRTFFLAANNGDNPPIRTPEVSIHYSAPLVTAKVTAGAPLFLYYGNPKADAPQYDLRLVRNELWVARAEAAGLCDEEILKPAGPEKRGVDAGSPWLWLALAGVVVALLAIVARLLPRPEAD